MCLLKLIVGLGNPGKKYEHTRHNIGFKVIDELEQRLQSPLNQSKFKGLFTMIHHHEEKIILLKPLTYMNVTGECVRPLMDYYHISIENLLVIYDDLDLPVGKIRLRKKGSAGGHNGVKSLIKHLGSSQFKRIRIGIDRPPVDMAVEKYVLGKFSRDEKVMIDQVIEKSADACEYWFNYPFEEVMSKFNER